MGVEVEQATADLADAFPHIFIHGAELHNNLIAAPPRSESEARLSKIGKPRVGLSTKLGFGSTGGPLIWGRIAAGMGRLGQATLRPQHSGARSKLRIYLDDPIMTLMGPAQHRRRELTAILLLWSAAGFRISWGKGELGSGLAWIGVEYEIIKEKQEVIVRIPAKAVQEAVDIASQLLLKAMGSVRLLRKLAGKGSWIFSIAPRSRWVVQRLWAIVTQCLQQGETQSQRGRGGGKRFALFSRKQAELPLRWIVAYWGSSSAPLRRVLTVHRPPSSIEVVLDASPWGLGGYLQSLSSGAIIEFFASPLGEEDTSRFAVEIGSANGQQFWEALSILVALRLWARHFASGAALFRVRGDSMVALSLATKLASPSAPLNAIGAEIALHLELHDIKETFTTHTPGKLLVLADALSRMFSPAGDGEVPEAFVGAKRRYSPKRDASFYKVWCISQSS